MGKCTPLPWLKITDSPELGEVDVIRIEPDDLDPRVNGGMAIALCYGTDREANAAIFMDALKWKARAMVFFARWKSVRNQRLDIEMEADRLRAENRALKSKIEIAARYAAILKGQRDEAL